MASNLEVPRCINGRLVRPIPPSDDSPSTACQASVVCAPGGVPLGRGPPGFGSPPGRVPSRQIPPPPPAPMHHGSATFNAVTCPREWTPLRTRPKASGGAGPPDGPEGGTGSGTSDESNSSGNPCPRRGGAGSNGSGGGQAPGGGFPGGNPGGSSIPPIPPPRSTPLQQSEGAGNPGGTPTNYTSSSTSIQQINWSMGVSG